MNIIKIFAVTLVLAAGCLEDPGPSFMEDGGVVIDTDSDLPDTWIMPEADAGQDAVVAIDTWVPDAGQDVGQDHQAEDAGMVVDSSRDAGVPDTGSDSGAVPDSAVPDAATTPTAPNMPFLEFSHQHCAIDADHNMWCWGRWGDYPEQGDAVEYRLVAEGVSGLEGTCASQGGVRVCADLSECVAVPLPEVCTSPCPDPYWAHCAEPGPPHELVVPGTLAIDSTWEWGCAYQGRDLSCWRNGVVTSVPRHPTYNQQILSAATRRSAGGNGICYTVRSTPGDVLLCGYIADDGTPDVQALPVSNYSVSAVSQLFASGYAGCMGTGISQTCVTQSATYHIESGIGAGVLYQQPAGWRTVSWVQRGAVDMLHLKNSFGTVSGALAERRGEAYGVVIAVGEACMAYADGLVCHSTRGGVLGGGYYQVF